MSTSTALTSFHVKVADVSKPLPRPWRNRDDVAEWVAKQHFIVDRGIREIWYLPKESPLDEIRLLEVNEQVPFIGSQVEAIDFGLNVEGARFRLLVADLNGDQLQQVKTDPLAFHLVGLWTTNGSGGGGGHDRTRLFLSRPRRIWLCSSGSGRTPLCRLATPCTTCKWQRNCWEKHMPGRTGQRQTRTAHSWASCEVWRPIEQRKSNWGMRARMRIGDT